MREKIEIEIVRKYKACFCIEGRIYIKDQCKIIDIERLLEEADTIPEYNELCDIDALFCVYDISYALYDSVKRLGTNGSLEYNSNVVRKVSTNLYHVEVSKEK